MSDERSTTEPSASAAMTGPAAGGAPQLMQPTSVEELADVMRGAASGHLSVRARGTGTKWTWGGLGAEPDVVVDLSGMNAVIEHAAGDLVATVQAGTPLADVQHAVGDARQWLALDPPQPQGTIGGVVATAQSGPRRLRFGTPRDLLIGVTVVLSDGTVARSGGKVVKNVAGYDLGKLFTGSFGTLGVIAECTFRLHPLAPARRVVTITCDNPADAVRAVMRSVVVPTALEWDGGRVHILIESIESAAQAQAEQVVEIAGGIVSDTLPIGFGASPWQPGDVALKVTHRLSALGGVADLLRETLPDARIRAHAGSGVVEVGWPAAPDEAARVVDGLRARLAEHDGSVVVVDAPPEVKAAVDVWGPVRGLTTMRRIKERFDPERRMSPGRFVGGI